MRNFLRTLFTAVLFLAFLGAPALAQTKIATVDLKQLFENYYKTKLASQAIQDRADELEKDYTSMAADLKKRSDQYEQIVESANDQAVSDDERARRKQEADDQYKQLQDSKAAIDQFDRQAQMTLADQKQRMHDNIMDEIKKLVAEKAKAGGYTLVLDTSGQTSSGIASVIYTDGNNDLTSDALKELNAAAPPDMPDSTTTSPVFVPTNSLPYGGTPDMTIPASAPGGR